MSANGLSIARSLGRRGIPVYGLDSDPAQPGMFSRYCQPRLCPDVNVGEEPFIQDLILFGKAFQIRPVLHFAADEYILAVSRHRERIEPYFDFTLPQADLVEAFLDKEKSADLVQRHQLPHPRTYTIRNLEEAEAIAPSLSYPCLLKPILSHIWRLKHGAKKGEVVASAEELMAIYCEIHAEGSLVAVQEIIPGEDSLIYVYTTYINKQGISRATFTSHKVRQYPIHFGIACFDTSERSEELIRMNREFFAKIGYRGIAAIEYKLDPRDKQFKFIEVNMRTVIGGNLTIASGVDLPYIYYADLTQCEDIETHEFKDGVRRVDFMLDLGAFFHYRRLGELTLWKWLQTYRRPLYYTYFAWDDLRPWMMTTRRLAGIIGRKCKSVLLPAA